MPVTAKAVRQIAAKPKNIRAGNRNFALSSASSKRKILIRIEMMNRTNGNNVIESDLRSSVCTGTIDAPIGKERLQQTMPLPIRRNPTKSFGCPYCRANWRTPQRIAAKAMNRR